MHLNPILTELLRNNELPSELNLQETMQLRSRANEDLLHVDTEIQRLMAKREQVQRSLDIYNIILSPARRLLPDILQEIFYHCIVRTYPILSVTEAPMVLTRVCSLWRSVALSSPRIWTRLHIPLPGDPRVSSNSIMSNARTLELREKFSKTMALRCQAVKEWLDRSGSCPLLLSIAHPFEYSPHVSNDGEEEDGVAGSLFQIIHPYAPRWEHLRLSMPFSIYQKLETKIPLDRLSRLQSFTGNISSPGPPQGVAPTPTPLHIIELPSLKKLSLNCLQLTINLGHYRNSWNCLTNMRFESPVTDTDFLELLRQCGNLIILDVNVQVPWIRLEHLEPNLAMVLLPHLESLKLRETGESSAAIFAVNAPSLKLLQYRCPPRYHSNFEARLFRPEELIWLISNAAASLATLSIDPQTFEPEDVLECLRLAVHVKNLTFGDNFLFDPDSEEINGIRYHDFFDLEAFTVPTTESESSTTSSMPLQTEFLLPKLESLEVNDGYIIGDDKIRRILMSRIDAAQRRLTSPLRYVKIQFWRQREEDIVPEIVARARDVGIEMKLDLAYRPSASPSVGPLSPSFLLPDH
jgi:hypothetical protein